MLKRRLIPVLFLKNGLIVRSQEFKDFREFGNPIGQLERLNDWDADELIYIDITREGEYNLKRDDHKVKRQESIIEILHEISKSCFMPLTFGGRIKDFKQASDFIKNGADKVIINTGAYLNPNLITEIADHYGTQCVVVGIDYRIEDEKPVIYINQGTQKCDKSLEHWVKEAVELGAGEIFLNSIDRDGTSNGYDVKTISFVSDLVQVPVIACGGAGVFTDFVEVFDQTKAQAVAAGNIFNFTENAYRRAKAKMIEKNCNVRPFTTRKLEL